MKLVVSNSPEDLAARQAEQEQREAAARRRDAEEAARDVLTAMAANLIRIVRGAGKPYMIVQHAAEFVKAVVACREAGGGFDPQAWASAVRFGRSSEFIRQFEPLVIEELEAEEEAIRGALQVVASRLVGQQTQASMGDHEFHEGVRRLLRVRDERRAAREAAIKAAKPPRAKPKKRKKAPRKPRAKAAPQAT